MYIIIYPNNTNIIAINLVMRKLKNLLKKQQKELRNNKAFSDIEAEHLKITYLP